jgi:hypothetical protein
VAGGVAVWRSAVGMAGWGEADYFSLEFCWASGLVSSEEEVPGFGVGEEDVSIAERDGTVVVGVDEFFGASGT